MPKINQSISVFLPAYNEESNITEILSTIGSYLDANFFDYEIIVVDDGSKDKTSDLVKIMGERDGRIRLVSHQNNMGYAQALRTGFKNAAKDLIFYTDSDRQFDIKNMARLIAFLDYYDVVTGYRIERRDPLMRIWMAKIFNSIFRFIFGLKIRDIDCAFKLYKRYIFENIKLRRDISTGVVNAEIFLKAIRNGFKLAEVGVEHYPRIGGVAINELGKSGKIVALVKPKVIFNFLADTIKLWLEMRKIK